MKRWEPPKKIKNRERENQKKYTRVYIYACSLCVCVVMCKWARMRRDKLWWYYVLSLLIQSQDQFFIVPTKAKRDVNYFEFSIGVHFIAVLWWLILRCGSLQYKINTQRHKHTHIKLVLFNVIFFSSFSFLYVQCYLSRS